MQTESVDKCLAKTARAKLYEPDKDIYYKKIAGDGWDLFQPRRHTGIAHSVSEKLF